MTMTKISLPNNRVLDVYDDYFSFNDRYKFFNYIKNSIYKIGGNDGSGQEQHDQIQQIYSVFSPADIDKMEFSSTPLFKEITDRYDLQNRQLKLIRVNFSPPSERNFIHCDAAGVTVLYYASITWKLEWGGHTLFMDDNLDEAVYTCIYKPGRMVVFDGTIPHMIMTPTMMATQYRYSLALQFGALPTNL
jgi:hypothetical protein